MSESEAEAVDLRLIHKADTILAAGGLSLREITLVRGRVL